MATTAETLLLDLPDELLIRCLAGSGGLAIRAASVACSRLHSLGERLKKLPVNASAASPHPVLAAAIKDAAERALAGCYGSVDYALLFCANYGNGKKKFREPTDLAHAVYMLRDVLGQDVAIVGCACSGVMGVGPDAQPLEIDATCTAELGRAAAAARKKHGLPPLPTKGVAVLLGKLPPGCVARTFAQTAMEGPPAPPDPESPEAAAGPWSWPFLDNALALTDSQKERLRQQLMATTTTADGGGCSSHTNAHTSMDEDAGHAAAAAADAEAAMELGASSPDTAAAAEGLMSVVAAAAAAAGGADAGAPGGAAAAVDDVELVPQLCFLLYDSSLQSFGYTESVQMERALTYLAARGIAVVGGASSGAGDLFFSPGADGSSRLLGEPAGAPQVVGLMLCTAKATLAAQPQPSAAPAPPAAAGGGGAVAAAQTPVVLSSSTALHSVAFASMGLGPAEGAPLFSAVRARLVSSQALSVNHVAVQLNVEAVYAASSVATPLDDIQAVAGPDAAAAAAAAGGADAEAGAASTGGTQPPADEAEGSASTESAGAAAAVALVEGLVRRSARLASASFQQQQQQQVVTLSPLHHMFAALVAASPRAGIQDDDEDDEGQFLAVWEAPATAGDSSGSGTAAAAVSGFTGDEPQAAVCELLMTDLSHDSSSGKDTVELTVAVPVSAYEILKQLLSKPNHSLCMQVVGTKGAACARTVRRGVEQLLPKIFHTAVPPAAATAPAAAAAGGGVHGGGSRGSAAMQDCYDALARGAAASGARSGLQAINVCSCTGRGQSLYFGAAGAAAAAGLVPEGDSESLRGYGDVSEARIVDTACGQSVPFVGVYVSGELGPEVQHMNTGWCVPAACRQQQEQEQQQQEGGAGGGVGVAEMQGFTSMFAAWGCLPGSA